MTRATLRLGTYRGNVPDDGHLVDDVVGDAAALVFPGAGPVMGRAFAALRHEWQRNTSRALKAAVVISGLSREDLEELLEKDPALTPLYLRVLWAAGMNGHDETLRAMGATLGEAVRAHDGDDYESIADADQALIGMSRLTPRHFRILRFICSKPRPMADRDPSGWQTGYLAEELGMTEERMAWCLTDLAATGLTISEGRYGGELSP